MSFENILGNNDIKKELNENVKNNSVAHSYLFKGKEGIGKKLFAIEFAKMMLCLSENKYCNNCNSCIKFDSNNNPDFEIIKPDGNSIKIEQIRELLDKIYIKPIVSNKKIFIIDNADKMTDGAQNALLKTLEEPPEYILIILITSNENKLLNTIKSRCLTIPFKNLNNNEIEKYLKKENISIKFSDNLLKMCNGSIGKLLEVSNNLKEYDIIEKNTLDIINNNIKNEIDIIKRFDILYLSKEIINDLLDYMSIIIFEYIKTTSDYRKRYLNIIEYIEFIKEKIIFNVNYEMCIDNLLLKIWEEIND